MTAKKSVIFAEAETFINTAGGDENASIAERHTELKTERPLRDAAALRNGF